MSKSIPSSLLEQWELLIQEGQPLTFRKGQVLFYEGHQPYGIFILESGEVEFTRNETRCSKDHFISVPKGRVIGMEPFLEGRPYTCTCTTTADCKLLFINKTQLLPHLDHDHGKSKNASHQGC